MDNAFFVAAGPVPRQVELPDGSTHTLHFKQLPGIAFRRYHMAESSADEAQRVESILHLICESLCEADGKPALTITKARQLTAGAMGALFTAVLEVNGYAGKKPSQSAAESGSATS